MRKALRFAARIFTEDKSRKSRRSQSRRLIVEPLESRRLLTGDLPFFVPQVDALPAAIASQVVPVQQAQTDSVANPKRNTLLLHLRSNGSERRNVWYI